MLNNAISTILEGLGSIKTQAIKQLGALTVREFPQQPSYLHDELLSLGPLILIILTRI